MGRDASPEDGRNVMLTVKEVRAAVQAIKHEQTDDEAAHVDEDRLHQMVLEAIAKGTAEDARGCARAALRTQKLHFARWCA